MSGLSSSYNSATHFSLPSFTFGPSAIDSIGTPVYEFEDSSFGSIQPNGGALKSLPGTQSSCAFSDGGLHFGPLGEHPTQDDLPLHECLQENHPFYSSDSQQESQCVPNPCEYSLSLDRSIDSLTEANESQASCGSSDYLQGSIPEDQKASYDPEKFIHGLSPSSHPLLEDIKQACTGKVKHPMAPPLKMTGYSDLDLFMLHQLQTAVDAYRNHRHIFDAIDCLGDQIMADFQATCKQIQDTGPSVQPHAQQSPNSAGDAGQQTDTDSARLGNSKQGQPPLPRNSTDTSDSSAESNSLKTDEKVEGSRYSSCSHDNSATGTDTSSSHTFSKGSSSPAAGRKKSSKLPPEATFVLKKWLFDHSAKPYPDDDEKQHLCLLTGLSLTQVCNWFINARRRILRRKKK